MDIESSTTICGSAPRIAAETREMSSEGGVVPAARPANHLSEIQQHGLTDGSPFRPILPRCSLIEENRVMGLRARNCAQLASFDEPNSRQLQCARGDASTRARLMPLCSTPNGRMPMMMGWLSINGQSDTLRWLRQASV
jgi:hypothetical protein